MSLRNYGTNRPIDTGGLLRRGVVLLASLLLVCTLMAGAVSADTTTTATVTINDNTYSYPTLVEAFADAVNMSIQNNSAQTTVKLLSPSQGGGIAIMNGMCAGEAGGSNIILDLNGKTYTVTASPVGSAGTENQAFHLEENNTVLIKDGTLDCNPGSGTTIRMIIQNYCNLTLNNVKLDGSKLNGNSPYTLSNNFGNTILKGSTGIIAKDGEYAFDVCYAIDQGYPTVSVTIADNSVEIKGKVEYGVWGTDDEKHAQNTTFIVPYDYVLSPLVVCSMHESTGYYWKAIGNNQMKLMLDGDSPLKTLNDSIVVSADGKTATLLRDVTTTETITVDKAVTLDLNGHTITGPADATSPVKPVFEMNNANAALTLKNSASTGGTITGYRGANVKQGSLTVKSGVTIDSTYAGLHVFGAGTDQGEKYSVATIEAGAVVKGQYGVNVFPSQGTNAAYGAVLDVAGSLIGKTENPPETGDGANGIFVSGNIKKPTGSDTHIPQIIIREGAVLSGDTISGKTGQAIAGNGYAKITINGGTFTGAEALGVKSGEWIINGGEFTAKGDAPTSIEPNTNGAEKTGAAVSVTTTYEGPISLTINGGTFTSTHGDALYLAKITGKAANVQLLKILGGTFTGASGKAGLKVVKEGSTEPFTDTATKEIIGGKYSSDPAAYLPAGYTSTEDGGLWTVAKEVPKAQADVTKDETGTVTKIDTTNSAAIATSTKDESDGSVILKLQTSDSKETGDVITLIPASGQELTVSSGVVTGPIAAAVIKPAEIVHPEGQTTKLELSTTNLEELFKGTYELKITNEPKASDMGSTTPENIVAGISVTLNGIELSSATIHFTGIHAGSKTPQVWHAKDSVHSRVASTYSGGIVTATATGFSSYYVTLTAAAVSSGSGNTNNAFRVLFETQGGSYVSPATGLSYGDKISQPANPVKDGYTFGGWYKDAACTQSWSFSDSIPGDMTLYAKWTSSGTAATATQTAQTTAKATTAPAATQAQSGTTATTAAPVATTAAGAQPTLTQAPAPVLGGLFGLLIAGVLLRRRE